MGVAHYHRAVTTEVNNFTFSPAAVYSGYPCSAAAFEVNSEPHTRAHPSVRLCVWLINGTGTVMY
jgi:hypothetical protein